MDFGRISLLVLSMIAIVGCQSSPPSQDHSPAPPSPQSESSEPRDDSTPEKGDSSSPFDGLEESDEPVVPPESMED